MWCCGIYNVCGIVVYTTCVVLLLTTTAANNNSQLLIYQKLGTIVPQTMRSFQIATTKVRNEEIERLTKSSCEHPEMSASRNDVMSHATTIYHGLVASVLGLCHQVAITKHSIEITRSITQTLTSGQTPAVASNQPLHAVVMELINDPWRRHTGNACTYFVYYALTSSRSPCMSTVAR